MSSIAYFEIQADEPEALIRFYETIFGWRFVAREGSPIPYWRIQTDGIHGGLLARPAAVPGGPCGSNAYVCSVEVDDFDVGARRITDAGGQIALPKFAIPRLCWQGYFVDPAGNTFGLFQADDQAA